ncbi:TetR/AcrR family transcriptional regulator [Anoxynatronum sibiricum]|uniref:TetR/AcrR family transcriptional regulator n=1 Tax=Anoxynatronum sibiricum TaxID=210623 RepID=A0ABU9VS58_9CLOT
MAQESTKEKILKMAKEIILDKGVNHFTLEEVAKQAGISKGGLLYHFNSKEALIKGMLQHYMNDVAVEMGISQETTDKMRVERVLLESIRQMGHNPCEYEKNSAGLLAAIVMNRELIEPLKEYHHNMSTWIAACDDSTLAHILFFALAGIRLSTMMGLNDFDNEAQEQLLSRMAQMARDINHQDTEA